MLDTMIFDRIIEVPCLIERVRELCEAEILEILITQVQERQLREIKDGIKLEKISRIPRKVVGTPMFFVNYSKVNLDEMGPGEVDGLKYEDIQKNNPKHMPDSLIALAAASKADILVTDDDPLLRKTRRAKTKLKIWDFAKFHEYLDEESDKRGSA